MKDWKTGFSAIGPVRESSENGSPMEDDDKKQAGDAAAAEQEAYTELQCYTLAHRGSEFIHQHVVDAWTAQHADARTKPIAVIFALVGLHLHVEKGFSGRRVQRAHMALARRKRTWAPLPLPRERGSLTASWVMAAPAGTERDRAIDAWCADVWGAFRDSHGTVAALLSNALSE